MTAPHAFPIEVDDLDARWFSHALRREVTQATVLDRSTGTTGRARVALVGELGGVDADHAQHVGEACLQRAQLVEDVQAVRAAERPEVQ